jgi:hypothetical protein
MKRTSLPLLGRRASSSRCSAALRPCGHETGQRETKDEVINAGTRQMPNERHLKRLISDAVFEAHNTHGGQAAGDRLHISREDSRIIASAVFDVLRRANVLLIDQPGQSNPETA